MIQDEAILCRYCHSDLTRPIEVENQTDIENIVQRNIKQDMVDTEKETGETKKTDKPVFPKAFLFGLSIGVMLIVYNMNKPIEYPQYGLSGHINNAIMHGFSSFLIYGFLFSLVSWIIRGIRAHRAGLPIVDKNTGAGSTIIFFIGLTFYFMFSITPSGASNQSSKDIYTAAIAPTTAYHTIVPTIYIAHTATKKIPTPTPSATKIPYVNKNLVHYDGVRKIGRGAMLNPDKWMKNCGLWRYYSSEFYYLTAQDPRGDIVIIEYYLKQFANLGYKISSSIPIKDLSAGGYAIAFTKGSEKICMVTLSNYGDRSVYLMFLGVK
jgi:hypothetical protein